MSAVISRTSAVLSVVHGDVECERCHRQAVLSFSIRLAPSDGLPHGGVKTIAVCRQDARSFIDLILDKGFFA